MERALLTLCRLAAAAPPIAALINVERRFSTSFLPVGIYRIGGSLAAALQAARYRLEYPAIISFVTNTTPKSVPPMLIKVVFLLDDFRFGSYVGFRDISRGAGAADARMPNGDAEH